MHSVAWLAVLRSLKALSLDFEDEDVILTAALPPGSLRMCAGGQASLLT